jgi:acetolactate synthase I/II/III large subunit
MYGWVRAAAYGMIKWKQQDAGFADFGLDLLNPDFVRLAEAYGCRGYRCERADDLTTLLRDCLGRDGVHLIEVPIDYSENHKVLTVELETMAKDAKTAPTDL